MTHLEETLVVVCCFFALALGVCGMWHHEDLKHSVGAVYVLQCGETKGPFGGDLVCTDTNTERTKWKTKE